MTKTRQAATATHPLLPNITLEIYPSGAVGWEWKWSDRAWWYYTNEEGEGLWQAGSQVKGTMQYSLPATTKRAIITIMRRRISFEYPYDNIRTLPRGLVVA